MKRLRDVDGYLEVVVEETGEGAQRCAKVTAYPFRYGTSTETPAIRAGDEPLDPRLVPARQSGDTAQQNPPTGTTVDCAAECGRIAELVETGSIKQGLVRDRCTQRCERPDQTSFAQCIQAAKDEPSATACLEQQDSPQP
jgi:hypothetical protein